VGLSRALCSIKEEVDCRTRTDTRPQSHFRVPKVDILASASVRSLPGAAPTTTSLASNGGKWLGANYNVSSSMLQQQTGRPLVPGLTFQSVNLLLPGRRYPDRFNALDVRIGKNLRFGQTRTNVAIDVYNVFNSNTGTAYNQTYDPVTIGATWLSPTMVLNPRFARFNVTFEF